MMWGMVTIIMGIIMISIWRRNPDPDRDTPFYHQIEYSGKIGIGAVVIGLLMVIYQILK